MLFTSAAALLLLLCPSGNSEVDLTPIAATCSSATAVQVFTSALFIDLISSHDPEVVFGLQLPSAVAAERIYEATLRVFQEYGLSNAEYIASTFKGAVSLVDPFTLPVFYINSGISGGQVEFQRGILNCDNAIDAATQYFQYEQKEFQYSDPKQLESYVQALERAALDLLDLLGYSLEENEQNIQGFSDALYIAYKNYAS